MKNVVKKQHQARVKRHNRDTMDAFVHRRIARHTIGKNSERKKDKTTTKKKKPSLKIVCHV